MIRSRRRWIWIALACAIAAAGVVGATLSRDADLRAMRPTRAQGTERTACALAPQAPSHPHPGMVWVPAGSFALGDTVYPEEMPLRRTDVHGFWIDRTEVTNDAFADFVKATNYVTVAERPVDVGAHPGLPEVMQRPGAVVFVMPQRLSGRDDPTRWWRYVPGANWRHPGGPDTSIEGRGAFPVVAVTIEDAQAYARWKGRTLPDEAQWEWAARAARAEPPPAHAQPKDANTWQGVFPVVNSGEDGFVGLAPVGCYAPNALGLYDMIGNVWELTADAWTPNHAAATPRSPDQPPAAMSGGGAAQQVIKGGSFLCAPNYCMRYRAGSRQPQERDLGASHLGFRTVSNAPAP